MKTFTTENGSAYTIISKTGKYYLCREGKKEIQKRGIYSVPIEGSKSTELELVELPKLKIGERAILKVIIDGEIGPMSTSPVVSIKEN